MFHSHHIQAAMDMEDTEVIVASGEFRSYIPFDYWVAWNDSIHSFDSLITLSQTYHVEYL